MDLGLKGKVALVTASSRGIGLGIAGYSPRRALRSSLVLGVRMSSPGLGRPLLRRVVLRC